MKTAVFWELLRVMWYKFTKVSDIHDASNIRAIDLKKEAINVTETSVIYQTTWRNIPEDGHLRADDKLDMKICRSENSFYLFYIHAGT
jgi:hypothetical protein